MDPADAGSDGAGADGAGLADTGEAVAGEAVADAGAAGLADVGEAVADAGSAGLVEMGETVADAGLDDAGAGFAGAFASFCAGADGLDARSAVPGWAFSMPAAVSTVALPIGLSASY